MWDENAWATDRETSWKCALREIGIREDNIKIFLRELGCKYTELVGLKPLGTATVGLVGSYTIRKVPCSRIQGRVVWCSTQVQYVALCPRRQNSS
jgi:hypothetical protein